jgi:hypothetical protein
LIGYIDGGCTAAFASKPAPTADRGNRRYLGVRESVGAGLLANAVGQVVRYRGLIFFAGKRAPTVDPGNLWHFGVRKSVGVGLLANLVGQVG